MVWFLCNQWCEQIGWAEISLVSPQHGAVWRLHVNEITAGWCLFTTCHKVCPGCKWPCKWKTGVIQPYKWSFFPTHPLITGRGPTLHQPIKNEKLWKVWGWTVQTYWGWTVQPTGVEKFNLGLKKDQPLPQSSRIFWTSMISWTTRVLTLLGTNGYMVYCSCISASIMLGYYQWLFQIYHPSTRDLQPKENTHTHTPIMWFKLWNDYHHPHVKKNTPQLFDHFPKYKVDPYNLGGSDCTYKGHNPSYPLNKAMY